jgi:hypothetical protein
MAVTVPRGLLRAMWGCMTCAFLRIQRRRYCLRSTLDGDRLLLGDAPLIPLSETTFGGPFGRVEVRTRNARGVARTPSGVLFVTVGGRDGRPVASHSELRRHVDRHVDIGEQPPVQGVSVRPAGRG